MQMPVDIKAVMNEALDIDEARKAPLSVSLYFDDTAPGDVQAHLRQAFASPSPNVRVAITYLDGRPFAPYEGDDAAVVVAGLSERCGWYAEQLRAAGVPTIVATTLPSIVDELAQAAGSPIPTGDLVAPKAPRPAAAAPDEGADAACAPAPAELPAEPQEPWALDGDAAESLDERMGGWIVDACPEKRLAFALAFPFVRRPLALESVNSTSLQNAMVGFLPIINGADMPVMTLNQVKMVLMIAAAHGEDMGKERVKEIAAVVCGAFACRKLARSVVPDIPVVGWTVKAAIGYAGTQAIGRAAIDYYEHEGVMGTINDTAGAACDAALDTAVDAVKGAVQNAKEQATGKAAGEGPAAGAGAAAIE